MIGVFEGNFVDGDSIRYRADSAAALRALKAEPNGQCRTSVFCLYRASYDDREWGRETGDSLQSPWRVWTLRGKAIKLHGSADTVKTHVRRIDS